ncbi:MAG: VCBS repeat-containing protein [Parcubacteria group bacterium]|nr:VCBS repeat-containing protein [Parcubacteria group bacterium]
MKYANATISLVMVSLLAGGVLLLPAMTDAVTTDHDYPRVLAWQLNTGKTPASELAKYDAVILNMNAHVSHPQLLKDLRRLNPNIVILAYTSGVEYPALRMQDVEPLGRGPWTELGRGIQPEWRLKTWDGKDISFWHQHWGLNPNAVAANGVSYADYAAKVLVREVLDSGLWDGLFFDTTWDTVSWKDENIDINADGKKDTKEYIDRKWHDGQQAMFSAIRKQVGDKYLIITNGDGKFSDVNNGRMFESFPEFYEGGWAGSVDRYLATDRGGRLPRLNIINVDTDNGGNFRNFSWMRFGLGSSLLANGYYNFDYGTTDRSYVNYYDEYNVSLGRPTAGAYNVTPMSNVAVSPGFWRRDFEKGIALVNAGTQTRTYTLPGYFEKVRGSQDPLVNDGKRVNTVTIAPSDSLILLRPLQEVLNAPYSNGAYARIFNGESKQQRSSFFSYDQRFGGRTVVAKADLDNDQRIETVVADGSAISVYRDNGQLTAKFYPYTASYRSGVTFAIGDLNNDQQLEIVTGTKLGGGPHVRLFNMYGRLLTPGFFAYASNFRGGVNVAVADLDGDGKGEIITGAGFGGGSQVRVFGSDGVQIGSDFFAYQASFRGGVNVAAGDLDGDGKAEIITGAGQTGGPHVKVFNRFGRLSSEFFAFPASSSAGVLVSAADFDNDRRAEIVAMTTDYALFSR